MKLDVCVNLIKRVYICICIFVLYSIYYYIVLYFLIFFYIGGWGLFILLNSIFFLFDIFG